MIDYIIGLIVLAIALRLSDSISVKEAKIITILGWLIAFYFGKYNYYNFSKY